MGITFEMAQRLSQALDRAADIDPTLGPLAEQARHLKAAVELDDKAYELVRAALGLAQDQLAERSLARRIAALDKALADDDGGAAIAVGESPTRD